MDVFGGSVFVFISGTGSAVLTVVGSKGRGL